MVLPLVEGPLVGTMKGIPEEEAVVEELDEVEVAEVGVAIETAFHQGVGLLRPPEFVICSAFPT